MTFNYNEFYSDIRKTLIIRKQIFLKSLLTPIFEKEYQKLKTEPLGLIVKIPEPLIVKGILKQDNDTYIYIYNKFYPKVEKSILSRGGIVHDAKDAFQDAIIDITILAQRNKLTIRTSIEVTIVGAAINKWKSRFSSKKHKFEKNISINSNIPAPPTINPLDELIPYKAISDSLDKIKAKCRKLIEEFYYANKDWKTIAQDLGYSSPESAKNQKYKCMKHFKLMVEAANYNI